MTTDIKYHVRWDRFAKPASYISILLILISIGSFIVKGFNWGLDFTGGSQIDVRYEQPANLEKIRSKLEAAHFEGAIVQLFGSAEDVTIRLPPQKHIAGDKVTDAVMAVLNADGDKAKKMNGGYVGPSVGADLIVDGFTAMAVSCLGILAYVGWRYQWRFAGGAVLALMHDVVITLGMFSLLQLEFDLTVLAAILTVIGYSLNDTVVVFDRMKENFINLRKATPWEAADNAINSMLVRTMVMSFTVVIVLVALLIWGGPMIRNFSIALLFGVIFGTYSSVYVATALAIKLGITREDLIPVVVEKEGANLDAMP
ncbi:protein translocase subunit SecF [Permianibacter sp. IMCC34836]|uniref:protein translocase subunit SecF n=1 Tax=Permianibacter fluminis TaxID=2738515 RepID=UPI00155373F5|nr:protein translocase subunit SecF [Permianibacter fluminis]NQD38162.1 protein translocase subunit SecF [Permianibacter fluminis]